MTAQNLHYYFQQETFEKIHYLNDKDKKFCEKEEGHRLAFMSRIEFFELTVTHNGEKEFPYDALDLAYYLKYL